MADSVRIGQGAFVARALRMSGFGFQAIFWMETRPEIAR